MTEKSIQESLVKIWQILSNYRSVMPDMQLELVASAFTFLRRIDCLIGKYANECASFFSENKEKLSDERLDAKLRELSGGYPFYNYSGYNFNGILNANNSVEVVMNSYLQGFSKNVLEFLDGMDFKQNLAIMQRQSRHLVEIIKRFSEIDLSVAAVDNENFNYIITSLLGNGNVALGELTTPIKLSELIAECLLSDDIRGEKKNFATIYDPVCGTGSMLAITGEKAKSLAVHQDNISLYGQEVNMYRCSIAKAIALLVGNEYSHIQYGNTLTDDLFPDDKFQYIIAHFPFGLSWKVFKDRIVRESVYPSDRFYLGLPSLHDSQFLFIEHILSKMDDNGSRAAFMTTGAVLSGGFANSGESRIRRWLFENDRVETIIKLPEGVLPLLGIPVYLWILTNKKRVSHRGRVRLIDASKMAVQNNRYTLDDKFAKRVVQEYRSDIVSTKSVFAKNDQFGFYEVDLLENGKKKERVEISLDTDIHEFVEKERQPYTKGKITIDYSSVDKGYSVQFDKFFTQDNNNLACLDDATKDLLSVIDAITSLKTDVSKIRSIDSKTWPVQPLRLATEVVFGVNRPPVSSVEGLPLLSVSYLRNPSSDENLYEVTPRTKFSTNKDAIIIVKGVNSGEVFRGVDGILTPSVASVKCIDESKISPRYLYYLLKGYEKELMAKTKGTTIKSLDSKSIPDLKCMIPPIKEQLKMAEWLDRIICKIDKAIEGLGSASSIFSFYRQTLIENVVHGKVLIE